MTDITEIELPSLALDLTPYRIKVPEYDYVEKHKERDETLEAWSQRLMQYAQVIEHYLNEARELPEQTRGLLQGFVDEVHAAELLMRDHIASLRLPALEPGNESMLMRVNADLTAFEVVDPSQLFTGWLESLSVTIDGEEHSVNSSPNIVLPEFGEYNLNSNEDYAEFIGRLQAATQAAADAENSANSISLNASEVEGLSQETRSSYEATERLMLIIEALSRQVSDAKVVVVNQALVSSAISNQVLDIKAELVIKTSEAEAHKASAEASSDLAQSALMEMRALKDSVSMVAYNMEWAALTGVIASAGSLIKTQQIFLQDSMS